jgi:hypothetical protein
MKKYVIFCISFLVLTNFIYSQNIFNEFKEKFNKVYIEPFNKDLTGVVCSNVLTTADSLGLFTAIPPSVGLNIKLNIVGKKISDDNVILNEAFKDVAVKIIPFAVVQIEKGLPLNLDIIARYSGYENFVLYGFGIKYKFLSLPPIVPVINISAAGFYNILEAKDILKHTSQSVNLIISVDKIPVVRPYVLVGADNSELVVDKKVTTIEEIKDKLDFQLRYELGINFSFIPVFYFNLGYGYVYNTEEYIFNLGFKF